MPKANQTAQLLKFPSKHSYYFVSYRNPKDQNKISTEEYAIIYPKHMQRARQLEHVLGHLLNNIPHITLTLKGLVPYTVHIDGNMYLLEEKL